MASEQQEHDYLDEHLPYMLKMLRYDYGQILQSQHYLSWNAHFELFAVHVRNLVNFLTNNDTGNFKASEFMQEFKARKGVDRFGVLGIEFADDFPGASFVQMEDLLIKFRHRAAYVDWVEENFADFLSQLSKLSPKLRAFFNDKKADPRQDEGVYMTLGPTSPGGPIACTALVAQDYTMSAPKGLTIVTTDAKGK